MDPGACLSPLLGRWEGADAGGQRRRPGKGSLRDRGGDTKEKEVAKQNQNLTTVSPYRPNLSVRFTTLVAYWNQVGFFPMDP